MENLRALAATRRAAVLVRESIIFGNKRFVCGEDFSFILFYLFAHKQMASVALALAMPLLVLFGGVAVLCYDSSSTGFFGIVNRIITRHIPQMIKTVLFALPGGKQTYACCAGTIDYVLNKPNPIIQCFYLLLVCGGFAIFVHAGLDLIPNTRLSSLHLYLPFAWVSLVLYSFYLASFRSAGFITKDNVEALQQVYKHDGFLFPKGKVCSTCHTVKVARSKHCRMENKCVAQFDHYCPWINNTVGALNFRYFLFFCIATMSFLFYGTYVFTNLFLYIIDRDRLWHVEFSHSSNPRETVKADWFVLSQYMLVKHGLMVFVLILCVVMGLTLFAFTAYQLWMVRCGTTSNEANKWANIQDFYDSAKWKRELEARNGDENTVKIDPNSEDEPTLEQRMIKDFPAKMPPNIYNLGFMQNLKQIVWPPVEAFNAVVGEKKPAIVSTATKATSSGKKKKKH